MVKPPKTIKIVLLIIGLCLLITITLYKKNYYYEKEQAEKIGVFFLNSLVKHDRDSAVEYVLPDVRLYKDLKSPKIYQHFKNLNNLEVVRVNYDSAKGRPEYYQEFYKIISVLVKIKTKHTNNANNPVGDYILFITLVKKSPQSHWRITELGSGP